MKRPLQQYWGLLVTFLRPQRRSVLALAALLLTSIALQIANPQLLRYFIDTAQNPQSETRALFAAAALFIGIALVTQLLSLGATYVSENVAWNATNDLRADLALHCLRLDMTFHKARTPGELIERIDGDVTALANFFSQFVIRVLGNVILMLGVLIVLVVEDVRIGAVMTTLAALLFLTLLGVQVVTVPFWTRARESSAALFGFIEERLSGTEDIRSSGAIDYTMNRLYERSRARLHNERRAAIIGSSAWMTPLMFFAIANGLTYWLGYRFFTSGTMTIGTVYLIFFYTDALLRPVIQITRQIEDLQKAGAGIVRVRELYSIQSDLTDGAAELLAGPLTVEFDGVTFGYDDELGTSDRGLAIGRDGQFDLPIANPQSPIADLVLDDISFRIAAGRTLGILGRTGSGKTTLTRLLFRLYDVTSGTIRLSGVNIRDLQFDSL
ncbi:MAG TPA: ABC transporter ATP-binding protein, partial [Roseiflexaceae bacterium]